MIRCKTCGAEIQNEAKFCEYCGSLLNKIGKEYNKEAFEVLDIFKISNRMLLIGCTKQPIKLNDYLTKDNKSYKVMGIQKGSLVVNNIEANISNCGIILENITKKDVKIGDKFIFVE